jgi:short-subunit dehydrogenase
MNKKIVIVGASTGIGKALVEKAANSEKNRIIALSRKTELMEEQFIKYKNVSSHYLDLEKVNSIELENILADESPIDILINNAGYLVNKPFKEMDTDDFLKSFQINILGIMEVIQHCLPHLNKEFAHIVNISSMGGFQGSSKFPGLTVYSSSKAAMCGFTEVFAEEYKDSHIHMNCLCLGAVQTAMLEKAFPGYQAKVKPEEMASYIYDFAFNQGRLLNGEIIPVSLTTP